MLSCWGYALHWIGLAASIWLALASNPAWWLSAGVFFLLLWTWDI